jgi:hypothetical protein
VKFAGPQQIQSTALHRSACDAFHSVKPTWSIWDFKFSGSDNEDYRLFGRDAMKSCISLGSARLHGVISQKTAIFTLYLAWIRIYKDINLATMLQFDLLICGIAEKSLSCPLVRSTLLSEGEKAFYCILNLQSRMRLYNNLFYKIINITSICPPGARCHIQ